MNPLLANAMRPQGPQMAIAQPINDLQLVALMAADLYIDDAELAVKSAMDIVAETIVQFEGDAMRRLVEAKRALRESAN